MNPFSVKYPFRWSIEPIEPDEHRTCEICDDPATVTGMIYRATRVDPAEWIDLCDECAP